MQQKTQARMPAKDATTTEDKKGCDAGAPQQKPSPAKNFPRGPTPIVPPVAPTHLTHASGGRALFNPFLGLRKFSSRNPELVFSPLEKPQDNKPSSASKPSSAESGQACNLNSLGSRKKSKHSDSGATSLTKTIRQAETPHETDQESPTPTRKQDKHKKKTGRPKKVKKSITSQKPPSAVQAQASVSAIHASGDLIQFDNAGLEGRLALLAPGMGPIPRTPELKKKLEEDRLMIARERELLLNTMRF